MNIGTKCFKKGDMESITMNKGVGCQCSMCIALLVDFGTGWWIIRYFFVTYIVRQMFVQSMDSYR